MVMVSTRGEAIPIDQESNGIKGITTVRHRANSLIFP